MGVGILSLIFGVSSFPWSCCVYFLISWLRPASSWPPTRSLSVKGRITLTHKLNYLGRSSLCHALRLMQLSTICPLHSSFSLMSSTHRKLHAYMWIFCTIKTSAKTSHKLNGRVAKVHSLWVIYMAQENLIGRHGVEICQTLSASLVALLC